MTLNMIRTIAPLTFAVFTAVASASPQSADADTSSQTTGADPRVGKKVIVAVAGAALRTPEAIVWRAYLGETFSVALTNGEWLWIEEKGGWLWEKETVPYEGGVEDVTSRVQADPSAENFHLRGVVYAARGELDKAIADYNRSLQKKPGDAGVLNNRGQAHYKKQDYAAAIRDFSQAIKNDPKHFVAMNNRALCHIATGDFDSALKDLNAANKLNKEYPEALNNRGIVHSRQGRYKAAIADLTAALSIDPDYIDAYGNRSFAYRRQGLIQEAVADLETAISKSPLDYKPVNDLAWIYATTSADEYHQPARAVELATKACEMTQYSDWNALDTLAVAHAANGNFKQAQQWISTAIEKAPEAHRAGLETHQEKIFANTKVTE